MKKCIIGVAILLSMGGIFTGCLDNDEPSGIEQMRGAKAELYKAQAAVKNAEVAIRDAEAQYKLAQAQQEQVKTKMMELDLAIKQAESDRRVAELQGQMAVIQEEQARYLLEAQKKTAIAQHNYDQAIRELAYLKNQVNNTYAEQLDGLTDDLKNSMEAITSYKNNIMSTQRDLMIFMAGTDSTYIATRLERMVIEQEQTLLASQEDLEKLKDVVGTPVEEWEAKGKELLETLAAIDQARDTLDMKIAELENTKAPWDEKLTAVNRKMNEDPRPLEMTVPAAIQHEFITNLLFGSDFVYMDLIEYVNDEYVLTGGEVLKIRKYRESRMENSFTLDALSWSLSDFLEKVKSMVIPVEETAQAVEELKTLKGNKEAHDILYQAGLLQWQTSRDKYIAAKDAYFIHQNHDLRTEALAAVEKYNNGKKAEADKNALVNVLKDYYTKRAALDSVVPQYNGQAISKVLTAANLEVILAAGNEEDLLGSAALNGYDGNKNAGAIGAFYAACERLWGHDDNGIIMRLTPVTPEEYEAGDYSPNISSLEEPLAYWNFKYTEDYETLESKLTNREVWNTLYDQLVALNDQLAQEIRDLNAERRSYEEEKNAITAEISAIERQQSDLTTSEGVYNRILRVITAYFDKETGSNHEDNYAEALKALKEMIANQETTVLENKKLVNEAKAALEAWNQGLDTGIIETGVKAAIAQMESSIEYYRTLLAIEQKNFEALTTQKDALLEVLLGESYEE